MPSEKKIARWTVKGWNDDHIEYEDDEGRYVLYSDHVAALTAAEKADKTQTKHAQQERVYRNTEPRDGFVEDGLVPIDKWGPPTDGGSTLPEPATDAEPVRQWPDFVYDSEAEPNTRPPESRLREALEFYTDPENWKQNGPLDPNSGHFTGGPARAALAQGADDGSA